MPTLSRLAPLMLAASSGPISAVSICSDHSFAKGRWVRVNQEVVLNAPQKADGVARLWIDGKLVAERVDLRLRADAAVSITGDAASAQLVSGAAPHSTGASTASLTPFELFW